MYEISDTKNRERVRNVMERMREGKDYIRSGEKYTLLKGGAEMIMAEFGYTSQSIICESKRYRNNITYTMETRVFGQGIMVANGFGSCSTSEIKGDETDMSRKMNSAIKIAKKRSYVDAVLTASGSSWLFTQDTGEIVKEKPMTINQERYIRSLMDQGGIDQDFLYEMEPDLKGIILEEMTRTEASRVIEVLLAYMKTIGDQENRDR